MREKFEKEEEKEFNVGSQDKKFKSEKSSQEGEDENSSEDSRMRTTHPK